MVCCEKPGQSVHLHQTPSRTEIPRLPLHSAHANCLRGFSRKWTLQTDREVKSFLYTDYKIIKKLSWVMVTFPSSQPLLAMMNPFSKFSVLSCNCLSRVLLSAIVSLQTRISTVFWWLLATSTKKGDSNRHTVITVQILMNIWHSHSLFKWHTDAVSKPPLHKCY